MNIQSKKELRKYEVPQIDVVKFQSHTPLLSMSVIVDEEDEDNGNDDDS